MEPVILHKIPFQIDTGSLKKKLHIKEENPYLTDFMRLVDEAEKIGRPKALYKMALVDNRGEDFVIVDGIRLRSRVLRVNLELAQRIFPTWDKPRSDRMRRPRSS